MVNKPYELKHPLYPHPLAVAFCESKGMQYEPFIGSYDYQYQKFYDACLKDVIEGTAEKRPIWHYIPAVYRYRAMEGEKLYYSEVIQTTDQFGIVYTFTHIVGKYQTGHIDTYYDYRERTPKKRYTGVIEDHYYIDYEPQKVLDLAEAAQDNKHQQYYIVNNTLKKYTHLTFFTAKTFAFMDFDDLFEIARAPLVSDSLRNKIKDINNIDVKQEIKNRK